MIFHVLNRGNDQRTIFGGIKGDILLFHVGVLEK